MAERRLEEADEYDTDDDGSKQPSSKWSKKARAGAANCTTLNSTLRAPDHTFRFSQLCKVAKLVLVIPHSNAEERVFSMVRKNKMVFRPSLDPKGTFSNILMIKLANTVPAHCFEPMKELLKSAKSAKWEYNKEHSKK